jgi:hypothetical protein
MMFAGRRSLQVLNQLPKRAVRFFGRPLVLSRVPIFIPNIFC